MNADMLQQALRAFGTEGGNPLPVNPAELAALAQRAGLTLDNGQVASRAASATGIQYVFIVLHDIELAWPAANVAGVERVVDITTVPNTATWVLGVANLRGTITSVIDLRRFFGLPSAPPTTRSRIIVTSASGMVIGFLVDGVNEMSAVPAEAHMRDGVRHVAPPWAATYIDAYIQSGNRRIFIMDLERFLFSDSLHRYRTD